MLIFNGCRGKEANQKNKTHWEFIFFFCRRRMTPTRSLSMNTSIGKLVCIEWNKTINNFWFLLIYRPSPVLLVPDLICARTKKDTRKKRNGAPSRWRIRPDPNPATDDRLTERKFDTVPFSIVLFVWTHRYLVQSKMERRAKIFFLLLLGHNITHKNETMKESNWFR